MTDKQFLAKIIELYKLIYVNELILLLDLDGTILFAGDKINEITKLNSAAIVGKNHLQVLPLPEENLAKIIASIQKVITSRDTQEFLSINLNHSVDSLVLHCTLKPIINPISNNIVALSIASRKLNFPIYFYKLLMFTDTNFNVNTEIKHTDSLLTLREHEIAFLLFYCKSVEKVAQILAALYKKPIATKTIHNIIRQQLYPKFAVFNLESLQDKLYNMNYHKKLPVSMLANLHVDVSEI